MEKALAEHYKYIESQLANLRDGKVLEQLTNYHLERVRDFQHERFIHLIVTLFIGLLTVLCVGFLILLPASLLSFVVPLTVLSALLLVTELFYLWHYYKLENGTQKLYVLTKRIFELKAKQVL